MKTLIEREQRERERQKIVNDAVLAADHIIMDGSDGSIEETNWMTSEVAGRFAAKVNVAMTSSLIRKDMQ